MRPDSSRRTSPLEVSATADAQARTGWLSIRTEIVLVADLVNGNLYKFPPGGGVANGSTLVGTVGPSLAGLVFDSSGNLFAARNATTGDYTTGAVLQLDPSNASVIHTLATIPCAEPLSIDPLSGDLFTDDACGGGGTTRRSWRISSPATSPTLSVYATLPSAPNANIAFAPERHDLCLGQQPGRAGDGHQRPESSGGNVHSFAQFVLPRGCWRTDRRSMAMLDS